MGRAEDLIDTAQRAIARSTIRIRELETALSLADDAYAASERARKAEVAQVRTDWSTDRAELVDRISELELKLAAKKRTPRRKKPAVATETTDDSSSE